MSHVLRNSVKIDSLSEDLSPDGTNDYIMSLDATDNTLKKVLMNNFPGTGGADFNVEGGTPSSIYTAPNIDGGSP